MTPAGASTSLTSRINGMTILSHTHIHNVPSINRMVRYRKERRPRNSKPASVEVKHWRSFSILTGTLILFINVSHELMSKSSPWSQGGRKNTINHSEGENVQVILLTKRKRQW